jgi:hypothetical protein
MAATMEKTDGKPRWDIKLTKREKLQITAEDRERRAKHIAKFCHLGGAAAAKRPKEDIIRYCSAGGKKRAENYQAMRNLMIPESPESVRKRRLDLEAKREAILDALVESAEADGAEVSVVSAALRELRTEADRLIDREARAKAEQAVQAAAGPARVALVPAIPPAILPALVVADPAPGPPSICAD